MMKQELKIKFPYGRSNFASIVKQGYYYVDKTPYLEWLDSIGESNIIFLRPRRFGKSLFVSMMEYYYGAEHKDDFETLFGKYYIGKHPTESRNKYWILKFNFSGINTTSTEKTKEGFLLKVRKGIDAFIYKYLSLSKEQSKFILNQKEANVMLDVFLAAVDKEKSQAIYLIIDEYNHFTNELLAFDFASFQAFVSRNGFIRKFYENVKIGTETGIIDRIFITGVTPITLDSLTSGFNIGTNLSMELSLNEMMGFTEEEVLKMLKIIVEKGDIENIIKDLKKWYNAYRFHPEALEKIYNADMVLYFLKHYQRHQSYPRNMLDTNISSDYSKLRRLFSLQTPVENYAILKTIIEEKQIVGEVVEEFSFERPFEQNDFLSLLYYLGYLTIKDSESGIALLTIPNYVIEKLYLDYFLSLVKEKEQLPSKIYQIELAMIEMASKGNPRPFLQAVEHVLKHLSRRDYQSFDEKYVKAIIMALALQVKTYFVRSEREATDGYMDIVFTKHQPFKINFQYVFELKYLKKEKAKDFEKVEAKAKKQVLEYVTGDEEIQKMKGLQVWTLVVVKDEVIAKRVDE